MKKIIFLFVLLLVCPVVSAKQGHMILLAVSETDFGFKGVTADLYLEMEPGRGKVFIESFPLTKLDTQISTRFAKDIACQYLDADCSSYDFFYTIKGSSAIIGGPSAGAAIAALTVALLSDEKINEKIAVTGTINSGGIIGPVGGIAEKIEAAHDAGLNKVIIPKGQSEFNISNATKNFFDYGESLGVKIVEAYDLEDVLFQLTGKERKEEAQHLTIDPKYLGLMASISEAICERSKEIVNEIETTKSFDEDFLENEEEANDLREKGIEANVIGEYYSAASFCFGANVRYRYLEFTSKGYSDEEIIQTATELRVQAELFLNSLPQLKTLMDVQTFSIVKERLIDLEDNLNESFRYLEEGNKNKSIYALAYATERLYSAYTWSRFFGQGEKKVSIEDLKDSCMAKLAEAEERIQYVKLFTPDALKQTEKELERAYADLSNAEYDLCLFKASQAKAEANAAIDILDINQEDIPQLIENKLEIAKRIIIKQTKKSSFPIIGYSYYEYAKSLKDSETYSALLYSEYALELSNLDIYFKEKKKVKINQEEATIFIAGFIIGAIITALFFTAKKRRRRRIKF